MKIDAAGEAQVVVFYPKPSLLRVHEAIQKGYFDLWVPWLLVLKAPETMMTDGTESNQDFFYQSQHQKLMSAFMLTEITWQIQRL